MLLSFLGVKSKRQHPILHRLRNGIEQDASMFEYSGQRVTSLSGLSSLHFQNCNSE